MNPSARGLYYLITCEHAGNRIPAPYRPLFAQHQALLLSHCGHDPGAATLARELARVLGCSVIATVVSRLLIDLNRSPGHPGLFSEVTRTLPRSAREEIVARYYLPYRRRVERHIADALARGLRVIHISSHSFTPTFAERVRSADVGFLYDPARDNERALCLRWIAALRRRSSGIKLRRNYPYTGRSDGFCTWLRRRHPAADYAGIELEVNQRYALAGGPKWRLLRDDIAAALLEALAEDAPTSANAAVIGSQQSPGPPER